MNTRLETFAGLTDLQMAAIPEEQAGLCWDTVLDFNREREIRILYLRAFTIIQMKGIVIECCKNE